MEVKKCIYYFLNNVLNHIYRKDLLNYILHNFLLRLKANIFCNTKFDYFLLIKFVNNQIQFNQINNILPYIFYMLYSNEVNNFKFLEYKNFILLIHNCHCIINKYYQILLIRLSYIEDLKYDLFDF